MNLQGETVEALNATSLGRIIRRAARPAVHLVRRVLHPGVPPQLERTRLRCNGQQTVILHRRTFADYSVIRQCFEDRQYDLPQCAHCAMIDDLYQEILNSGKQPLIVDCGANIGASVLWFTSRYPRAHVLAVEPAPDNFELLQKNCAHLDADLRQAAIAPEDGFASIVDPGEGSLAYRTVPAGPESGLPTFSLSTLLKQKPSSTYTPFLLKLDIEGAEKPLFDGDCSGIAHFPVIIMEPHDWFLPGQGTSLGFFRFHAQAGRELLIQHENIVSIDLRISHDVNVGFATNRDTSLSF
jgi:FkbM family methyltransferase